jgi:hypothetical protein
MGSRVGPAEGDEVPPPAVQAPQARVYGRPVQPAAEEQSAPVVPFARPGADPVDSVSQDLPPLGPKTPSPGGRAAPVRATASARVAPPQSPPAGPDDPPFTEFTADVAGRGRTAPPATGPDNYGENTTDMAGRGPSSGQPYVPAAAVTSMYARPPLVDGFSPVPSPEDLAQLQSGISPDRPRLGGVFPGPASTPGGPGAQSRATVAPPGPDETSSWPGPGAAVVPEQGRFDQFKPDAEAESKPEAPHVRLVPVLLAVVLGAVLLVGVPTGIVWLISRGSDTGFSANVGDCVQRNGTEAVRATCGGPNTFQVAAKVDAKEQCPDPAQPYVLNPTNDGKTQVLCLKPSS